MFHLSIYLNVLILEVVVIMIYVCICFQLKEMPSERKNFQQKAFAPLILPVKGSGWLQPHFYERLSFSAR